MTPRASYRLTLAILAAGTLVLFFLSLTVGPAEFDEIEQILRSVLTEAWNRL